LEGLVSDFEELEQLTWAIEQRAEIQRTLLALYDILARYPPQSYFMEHHALDNLVGAAFSLWRAVFLSDTSRDYVDVHQDLKQFVRKVITDNAINFSDDLRHRDWTLGYYLDNAKLRLQLTSTYLDAERQLHTWAELEPYVLIKGTARKQLIQYEWESLHYALRYLMKKLHGKMTLEVKLPTVPKPSPIVELFT
jgi:hypothetical protein